MNSMDDYIDKFTNNAKMSLSHADGIARALGSNYIGTEHILLGVLAQSSSIASKVLRTSGVDVNKARLALDISVKPVTIIGVNLQPKELSENAKLALKMSWDIAQEFNQDYCGTEHILYSIVTQKNARATILLKDLAVDMNKIVDELEHYLNRQQYDVFNASTKTDKPSRKKGPLDFFGTDITELARGGKVDPLIGRTKELDRMVTILNRRHKNNPILIGEPGVGKTALIEGLAQRISDEDVPDLLHDKRIVSLDLASMIAGTKYRGEFEDRMKKVIQEIKQDSNVIIFIDEIHLLVGAGSAEGVIDAANILKPLLARGELKLIGATTIDEYNKHIEKDSALERRFQVITVNEPSKQETLAILRGLKSKYEDFHNLNIEDAVLQDTVDMSTRYINGRYFPDKAIDLLDEASSTLKVKKSNSSPQFRKLNKELKLVKDQMNQAVDGENYERAAHYKTRIIQIEQEIKTVRGHDKQQSKHKLSSEDIAVAVSNSTGIPLKKIKKEEARYLLKLEKHLNKFVIGQTEAVEQVSKAIRRSRSGVGSTNRPIGSFIFLGPSGVGKTELARVLAREVYDNEDSLIKVDMSEFSSKHTVSNLIGAPAGYVGYDDTNNFTDRVRRNPYSLILFDELEKAHPDVFNIFLQILEDGYLTNAKGRKIDFTNTIIITTSNIGADLLQKEAKLGFSATTAKDSQSLEEVHDQNKALILERLKKSLRPELLNRFDKVIVFRSLDRKAAKKVLKLQLEQLYDRLSSQGIGVKTTNKLQSHLLSEGFDEKNGVRSLRRVVEQEVGDQLSDDLLNSKITKGDVVEVGYDAKNKQVTTKVIRE